MIWVPKPGIVMGTMSAIGPRPEELEEARRVGRLEAELVERRLRTRELQEREQRLVDGHRDLAPEPARVERDEPVAVSPPSPSDPQNVRSARLEARATALQAALERRSLELRAIQRHACPEDLAMISRVLAGRLAVPRHAYEPSLWTETAELVAADVEETLTDLWASVAPPRTGVDVD
jgi:hypothetical protein